MSKKVIILGWHFNIKQCTLLYKRQQLKWCKFGGDKKARILKYNSKNYIDLKKNNENYKIYIISYPKEDFVKNSGVNGKIKKIIGNNTTHEILLLLHKIPWKNEKEWNEDKEVKLVQEVFSTGKLYYSISDNPKGILDNKNNEECFTSTSIGELDWDFVWEEFYIGMKKKKNKLLKLWLPLAIDIQGLSEVNDETEKEKYLEEIVEDWNNNSVEKLFNEHNDIIDNIEDENISEFRIEENGGIYKNIYKLKNITENIDELIDSNQDYFLPNFLHKLIETTDKIIEKQNN